MELRFLGAATTVTGSQFLLATDRANLLIDCGMFQGSPNEAIRNRIPFAYEPGEIHAVLLTHAHLDHCGMLPHLVASGFRGPIHATAGTVELAGLVLLDSAKLQAEFAQREERLRERHPERAAREEADAEEALRSQGARLETDLAHPLYDEAAALAAIAQFRGVTYGTELEVAPGVHATFLDAGHILGSAIIRLRVEGQASVRTIVFSGDLGRSGTPIIRDPSVLTDADYVVIESTYGGREHEPEQEAVRLLGEIVRVVADAKGVLLVPSFAIGRTQEVVWQLDRLLEQGAIPQLPLYLDSPMAAKATDIYRRHLEYFDDETRALLAAHHAALDYPGAKVTNDVADSRAIASAPRPYMVVASNGMLTGGRVLGHLRLLVGDPSAVLLFVGYQGEGTLGAHLQHGAASVFIDGEEHVVRCRVRSISGFSAHADEAELLAWLGNFTRGKQSGQAGFPRKVFIVHGDPAAQAAIEPKIRSLGLDTLVPKWRQAVTLD